MEPKKLQVSHKFDESPLSSNSQAITCGADKFILDFKGVFPQSIENSQNAIFSIHKTVILDPHVAKEFSNLLQNSVKNYEETYGEIKVPESVEKQRAIQKKSKEEATTPITNQSNSTYFG